MEIVSFLDYQLQFEVLDADAYLLIGTTESESMPVAGS
jgi:hypothetical protein